MSYFDRDTTPQEGKNQLRHQHSASSDHGVRALIPMWDSSDPERAPPPLPLNPQSPSITSRAGTSSAIQSAHAALNQRAQESAGALVPAPKKRVDQSPERALVKGNAHKRMQSMQPGSVRDLSLMLEGSSRREDSRSPDKQHRPSTPTPMRPKEKDSAIELRSPEKTEIPSPGPGPSLTPVVRPTARRPPPQCILGENTPPQSSTMLALQSMSSYQSTSKEKKDRDPVETPLADITNASTAVVHQPANVDALSAQILSLTSIATQLQKQMSQLSRRSRDNATDLFSLKEATNTRDEDIRKSLKDLMGNISDYSSRISSGNSFAGLLLDNKPHNPPSPGSRGYQLPRIPSPKSFSDAIDRGSISTPSLAGSDNATSTILLEKIIREMSTQEGQEKLLGRLSELSHQLTSMEVVSKVDELMKTIKSQHQEAQADRARAAVVEDSRGRELALQDRPSSSGALAQRMEQLLQQGESRSSSAPLTRGADLVNDDMMKIIRSVKDSVAQGGGMTAEVKALVRELRGEVLGMGRELGQRLETMNLKSIEETEPPSKDEVSRVIDESLEQMKSQLNHVLREHRRASAVTANSNKTLVDYQEIYNAMRAALRDNEASQLPDLSRDDVIEAVKDAWENYKPEIEVQQLGLEREEVLACLQEGLREYAPQDERPAGATREEVFKAVIEGFKHFNPPQVETPASLSRDEIIEAVRDCLEEFEFPVAPSAVGAEITREDMYHAVKEGLNDLDLPRGGALVASTTDNDELLSRLGDLMGYLKLEFKAVSEEAKDNVAANGRDTEQVLDATKDGMENLRLAIETYVDRASGATDNEEFMQGLLRSMDDFKDEMAGLLAHSSAESREQLKDELESLREVVNSSMVPAAPAVQGNNKEVLEALHNSVTNLRQEILRPRPETSEILDALQDGLNELKAGIDRVTNKPVDLTANDEILDALKSGLDSVRSDIETLRDSSNDRAVAVATLHEESTTENAIIPADMVKLDDIKNLEVLITQLQIKIEAMEPEPSTVLSTESVQKDDLSRLEEMLRNVQQGVEEIGSREVPATKQTAEPAADRDRGPAADGDAATREDVIAIETILRNTKARLDDLIEGDQSVRKEHLDVVETLILETRESMGLMTEQIETISRKDDLATLEALMTQITVEFDEWKETSKKEEVVEDPDKVSKTDVEAVETVVLEIKGLLDGIAGVDFSNFSNKDDLVTLESLVKETNEQLASYSESSSKALTLKTEELDTKNEEVEAVGERVSEVKIFLEQFQETIQGKLDEGSTGVEAIGKLLDGMSEKIDKNENVGQDLKEMFDTMKSEFEDGRDIIAGAKLESDEKLQQATDDLALKIDDKIAELVLKYDEFQVAFTQKQEAGEARDVETEAAVVGTKAVAEELKLLIDTLGCTVTDSMEKMEEASKTVFTRVDDMAIKSDDNHNEDKAEHQQTREQVSQALTMVEGLQSEVSDSNAQVLEAVKDILQLVGQHYEHSKSSATVLQEQIIEAKPELPQLPPPPEKYDDSEVQLKLNQLVEQMYDDSELRTKLDLLATESKYDDTGIQAKLDQLVTHNSLAEHAYIQLENLDKVHASVVKTAADINDFLSSQTARIADDHEDREKTLHETTVALERKLAEQDHVEVAIRSLKDEEDRLRNGVMSLRTEQESLIRQKTRLTGDVSSLETALRLRKEELSEMEMRAERLERRIVDGVMDHSRVLLMYKATKGSDTMNRKRVKKSVNDEAVTARSSPKPAVSMALATKRNLAPTAQPGSARRIVSLSQMNSNVSPGGVKRSQSVRTPQGGKSFRKSSWGGDLHKGFGETDKENMSVKETLEEEAEETPGLMDGEMSEDESDTGTLRRSSRGTTVMSGSTNDYYTESETGYTEGDYDDTASQWTESAVGTASSLGPESVAGDADMVVYGQ